MSSINNIVCSWSGGKDSCYALMQAKRYGYTPSILLNVLNEEGQLSRSHGIPSSILQLQAAAAKLPIELVASSWDAYEERFTTALLTLKDKYALSHAVFGDIDLQAHRDWEEKVCRNVGLETLLPLWQQDREQLVMQMLATGIKAMIVSCNEILGPGFLGRMLDEDCIADLRKAGVDVCGEHGEFHTLVVDCPLFDAPIKVQVADKLLHEQYWFCKLDA